MTKYKIFHYFTNVVRLLSHIWLFETPWTASLPFTTPELAQIHVYWVSDAILPSSLCHSLPFLPSVFPTSRSFPMNWPFASGGQSIGASASASVLPMNIQGWLPLGLTGLISVQTKGLSRIFSSTTIWKHQFFAALPFLWSNTHICTSLLEKS